MTTRTEQTTVDFVSPFHLTPLIAPQPPGRYRIDYDEEQIESMTMIAWRRTGAFIFLPAIGSASTKQQMVPISMADLNTLFQKDHDKS